MRKFVNGRLALTLFFVAILVLCQFIPKKGMSGADCNRSLVDPNANHETTYFPTYYGFPLPIVETYTEGCAENQTTSISGFYMEWLLFDILFVAVLGGALPYLSFSLLQRFRRRNHAE